MDGKLRYNQHVVTYNKLQGMNSMGVSAPWENSLKIIDFHPVKNTRD